MRSAIAAFGALILASLPAAAQDVQHAPPGGAYKKASDLVNVPEYEAGLGTLYVDPKTVAKGGPFLAYDRQGRLMSTIYMIPIEDLDAQKTFDDLPAPGGNVDHVSIYYNVAHPGVPHPHYHIVLWHVSKAEEQRIAQ